MSLLTHEVPDVLSHLLPDYELDTVRVMLDRLTRLRDTHGDDFARHPWDTMGTAGSILDSITQTITNAGDCHVMVAALHTANLTHIPLDTVVRLIATRHGSV